MNSQVITDYIVKNKNSLDVNNIFNYLKKYNLEFLLSDVLQKLKKYNQRENRISKNIVITSHKINQDTKDFLQNKYNIELKEEKIDSGLIAGYKIYTRDTIIDASLNTLLKNFKK